MGKPNVVGLILGIASIPQRDLSTRDKSNIIQFIQENILRKNMDHLVTGGAFRFLGEIAKLPRDHATVYDGCEFSYNKDNEPKSTRRVKIMFEQETPLKEVGERVRIILSSDGDLFGWRESYLCEYTPYEGLPTKKHRTDRIKKCEFVLLDQNTFPGYIDEFPRLFNTLIWDFKFLAEGAFNLREKRQRFTREVIYKLSRITEIVGM